MSDGLTAFLAFAAILGGIALYLAWLAAAARRLEARLTKLEARK